MRIVNKYLKQSIDRIDVDVNILNLLKANNIITIEDLCSKSKSDLKKLSLSYQEINAIQIDLQLLGLDLKI